MRIKRAHWGLGNIYVDVTSKLLEELSKSPSVKACNELFTDPLPGRYKHLTVHADDKVYTIFETSFFCLDKITKIKEKIGYYSVKEQEVYDYLSKLDNNTDYFEEHIVMTVINHTNKTGIVISRPDTYAGFYCFVAYYYKKINDIVNVYGYKLDRLFTKDGFTVYKDKSEDDLYKIIFSRNENEKNLYLRHFSPSNVVLNKIEELKQKYNIDCQNSIGVYYRGTDKIREIKLPEVEKYYSIIDNKDSSLKIFLQTDQQQILDQFLQRYGNRVVYFTELPFSSTQKSTYHSQKEDRVKNAIEFNASLNVIAKCKYMLMTDGSNVSGYLWNIRDKDLRAKDTFSIK